MQLNHNRTTKHRRSIWLSALLLCMLTAAGACQTTVLHLAPSQAEEPTRSTAYGSMIAGIFEISDAPDLTCQGRVKKIVITRNGWDVLVHFLVGGIYTSRRIKVYCD